MADLTVTMGKKVQLKTGVQPPSATNVRVEVQTTTSQAVAIVESANGQFAVTDMLPAQSPGNFKFRGAYYEYGSWGDYAGIWTTMELVASDPPETADYEVVDA